MFGRLPDATDRNTGWNETDMTQIEGSDGYGSLSIRAGMIDLLFGDTDLETMWHGLEDDVDHGGECRDLAAPA